MPGRPTVTQIHDFHMLCSGYEIQQACTVRRWYALSDKHPASSQWTLRLLIYTIAAILYLVVQHAGATNCVSRNFGMDEGA